MTRASERRFMRSTSFRAMFGQRQIAASAGLVDPHTLSGTAKPADSVPGEVTTFQRAVCMRNKEFAHTHHYYTIGLFVGQEEGTNNALLTMKSARQ